MKPWIIFTLIFATLLLTQFKSDFIEREDEDSLRFLYTPESDDYQAEAFKNYVIKNRKKYTLNSDEGRHKFDSFKNNLKLIEEYNSRKKHKFTLGIGPFADLTNEEFIEKMLMKPGLIMDSTRDKNSTKFYNSRNSRNSNKTSYENERILQANLSSSVNTSIPNYNWVSSFRPVRNQGNCGSCWAFASAAVIEAIYNLNFGYSLSFSPQQLVDCDTSNYQCNGGNTWRVLTYIQNNGIMYDSSYPYYSGTSTSLEKCKYSANQANNVVTSFLQCGQDAQNPCGRNSILSMLANGPIISLMDASSPYFQHYANTGSILEYNCTATSSNHAINIVGVSSDVKGGYYIVRNSWGSAWGENGYFRMRFNNATSTCFLEQYAWQPVLKKTNITPPAIPQCLTFYSGVNFQGTSYNVCQSQENLTKFNVSSFLIGNFTTVALYSTNNCTSSYYNLTNNVGSLSDSGMSSLVNNIGSVIFNWNLERPPQNCVWLYSGCCFSSNRLEICSDASDLSQHQYNFANQLNSVKFGSRVKSLKLYTGVNFGGPIIYSLISDRTCLKNQPYRNNVKSLKLVFA